MTKSIFEIRSEHQSRALPPCCTDAQRFAQEAERAAERGAPDEAERFAGLAGDAARSGAHELGHLC